MRAAALSIALLLFGATPAFAQEHGAEVEHEAEEAHQAEGEHHGGSFSMFDLPKNQEFLGAVFNFGLLLLLFTAFALPKIRASLSARRKEIEESLAEAQRMKAEAEAKRAEYQSRLDKLDSELDTIRKEMARAGREERDRIVADAEKKASRMRQDTRFVIDQQLKSLREELLREAVRSAVETAEKVLRETVTSADQQRLADEYLARLADVASAPKGAA
jgi:F-type H+-transporting ATPase subunit b